MTRVGTSYFLGGSQNLWNNSIGVIYGGLGEAFSDDVTSIDSSGVLATLTFNIINYGSCSVSLSGGSLSLTSSDWNNRALVTSNSLTVTINDSHKSPPKPIVARLQRPPLAMIKPQHFLQRQAHRYTQFPSFFRGQLCLYCFHWVSQVLQLQRILKETVVILFF